MAGTLASDTYTVSMYSIMLVAPCSKVSQKKSRNKKHFVGRVGLLRTYFKILTAMAVDLRTISNLVSSNFQHLVSSSIASDPGSFAS